MGRVSKHKRVKACDSFYKGPRRNPLRKGDLPPPNDDDQPAPKSLLRLLNFSKHKKKKTLPQKNQTTTTTTQTAPHKNKKSKSKQIDSDMTEEAEESENPAASTPQVPASVDASAPVTGRAAMFIRRPGESTRDYLERIDMESQLKVMDCLKKERKKSDKRKKYQEERRKKFKSKKQRKDASFKDFDDFKDEVKFNEVVQAPPQLSAKPRGSDKRSKVESTAPEDTPTATQHQHGLKYQQDIELERARVVEEYRLAKKLKAKDRTMKQSS